MDTRTETPIDQSLAEQAPTGSALAEIQSAAPVAICTGQDAANLAGALIAAAANQNVNADKLERIYQLYERIEARNAERAFNAAMVECQKEMRPIATDAANKQTHSKYATYYALDKALRPIYTKHGFAPSYDTDVSPLPGHIRAYLYLFHNAGHTRTYKIDMPTDGKGAKGGDVMSPTHAVGAAVSYGDRYLLKDAFNIAVGDDDDDNGADGYFRGTGTITEDRANQLLDLAKRAYPDDDKRRAHLIDRICKKFGVKNITFLTTKDFPTAVELINGTISVVRDKAQKAKETAQ
jgi:hypothetical protein